MKRAISFFILAIFTKAVLYGQLPADNPYATRYHVSGHWTDSLKWSNVTDASGISGLIDQKGNVDSAILEKTMRTISKNGGGVLYFKAGEYYLNYDVMIYNGVILRGADPGKVRDAKNSRYSPPTKFLFPKYVATFQGKGTPDSTAFKWIYNDDKADFGVVNIDINRGLINSVRNCRTNVILFGVRSNNAVDSRSVFLANVKDHAWQRYPFPEMGGGAFFLTFFRGVIANCRINDAITDDFVMPEFITNDGSLIKNVKFQYGYQSGIDVDNYADNQPCKIEILDNYVKGYYVSAIGSKFDNEKIFKGNKFEFLPCQDLVSDEFYLKENEERVDKAFEKQLYISDKNDTLRYSILKPKDYDPSKKYPILLFYHGIGQHGDKNPLIHFVYIFASDEVRNKYPYFVVIPHIKNGESFYAPLDSPATKSMQLSIALVKELEGKYSIDQGKSFVAGVSSGAIAVWETAVRYPGLFKTGIAMSGIRGMKEEQANRMKGVTFIISAGTEDNSIPIKTYRFAVSKLRTLGLNVNYFEYPNVGHWSWINLCQDPDFLKILFPVN